MRAATTALVLAVSSQFHIEPRDGSQVLQRPYKSGRLDVERVIGSMIARLTCKFEQEDCSLDQLARGSGCGPDVSPACL